MSCVNVAQAQKLKYVALVEMGQSPPSAEYSLSKDAGLPFLQGTADFGTKHPLPRVYCATPIKVSLTDDILISVRAPVGELNIANREFGIGRGLCAVRCYEQLDKVFAWWSLHWARIQLAYKATGSTYEAVAAEDIADLLIPLPSLDKQKRLPTTSIAKLPKSTLSSPPNNVSSNSSPKNAAPSSPTPSPVG